MTSKNRHIKEFIDYYCNLDVSPDYALFITGSWGSGKSYLIHESIRDLENQTPSKKILYVSLYGLATTDAIDIKFFQLLNPVLSSKKMVLAGKIAKGIMKGALKVDIDGDGKADGVVSPSLPSINIEDYVTNTENHILIFDDVERCDINLQQLFGYINYFVEIDGYKVILIADEEKLRDLDPSFKPTKEKVIGKTMKVEADLLYVYERFIQDTVKDVKLETVLTDNKQNIIQIFEESKYENLRSFRKTLIDFSRLWSELEDDVQDNSDLTSHLIKLFTLLSLEVYSGYLLPTELNELVGEHSFVRRLINEKYNKEQAIDEGEQKISQIEKKYQIDLSEPILNIGEWEDILGSGRINTSTINDTLRMSKYFSKQNTPDWIKLWHIDDLEDGEFEELQESVYNSFKKHDYKHPAEVKHVFGMMLHHAEKRLIEDSCDDIVRKASQLIEEIYSNPEELNGINLNYFDDNSSYAGLGYKGTEINAFEVLSLYLAQRLTIAQGLLLSERSSEIITAIRGNPDKLYDLLCDPNYGESTFYKKPILQFVDSKEFTDLVLSIPNRSKRIVCNVIRNRYEYISTSSPLISEIGFLEEVSRQIKNELLILNSSLKSKLSIFALEDIKTNIDNAVQKLKQTKQESSFE